MIDEIVNILKQGEGINVEFKESKNKINKDLYETVCTFLNRSGGEIVLGVKDNGEVVGIEESALDRIKKDFITAMNNLNKINPTYYLNIEEIKIGDKKVLYIFVPESQATPQADDKIRDLLELCKDAKTRIEMQEFMGIKDREHFRKKY